jgi:hypothetical protein
LSRSGATTTGRTSRSGSWRAVTAFIDERSGGWESPLPPAKRPPSHRPAPKLGAYRALIDAWLVEDREAPREQRHAAKRIWRRLVDEHGVDVAETMVRDHVRKRRRELGDLPGEVFIPQVHAPARTAGVDWGEAWVDLRGGGRGCTCSSCAPVTQL